MKFPIFYAHRGAWKPGRRENTTGAIERAASSGRFAYIELDVRRTRSDDSGDPTPVVIHDEVLDRLYDLYNIPKSKRHRLGQQISSLNIDIIRGEEIEISTLAEAMRASNGHPLNLEIKHIEVVDSFIAVINDMIDKYKEWSYEKIVISSSNWEVLEEIKQKEPKLGLAMIYGWRQLPKSFGRTYHSLDARWISFNKWLAPVMGPLSIAVNIPQINVYTVNSKIEMKILRLFGVKGFYTDSIKLPDVLD